MGRHQCRIPVRLLVSHFRLPLYSISNNLTRYYPIALFNNAAYTDAVTERGALTFLIILAFLMFSTTFAHMIIAGMETAETAGNIANLLFSLALIFNGVLVPFNAMPGFWKFMYYVSPFTYLVEALLSAGVANAPVTCASNEFLNFPAPAGSTCKQYMAEYIDLAGGYLLDPNSSQCSYCQINSTNTFLAGVNIYYDHAWRDFGILWGYILFNIAAAPLIYWLARVPKGSKQRRQVATKSDKAEERLQDNAALHGLGAVEKDDGPATPPADVEKGTLPTDVEKAQASAA